MSVLRQLVDAVNPVLAAHARTEPGAGRFARNLLGPERLFVMEAVYEGYLMHYSSPRAFEGMDPDLRLLAGDALFALGLERLAAAGDLEAVGELADLISRSAQAHAEGRPETSAQHWDASASKLAHSASDRAS